LGRGCYFFQKKVTKKALLTTRVTFFIAKKVTMLRHADPHPPATAQQPMLVAQKTRLLFPAFIWLPGLLARLFGFQSLFLVNDFD
jgi:hypothetical protein